MLLLLVRSDCVTKWLLFEAATTTKLNAIFYCAKDVA